jgi:ABC-type transport system involved in multi-copper enzyme maturation permease subunit
MTFLPIVERELRVTARRKSTYYLRFAAGLAAAIIGGMAFLFTMLAAQVGAGMFAGLSGGFVFSALSYYLFGICLLAGVFLAGDSLSEERREGTLGLLFLTDLKGYDVVLGKLLAVSLNAFYGLLAVFPVLGLSLVVGGVEGAEFWRMCLALLNALWVSTAIALWASSRCESGYRSMLLAGLLLILLAGLLPALPPIWTGSALAYWAASISPTEPFHYAQAANFWHHNGEFWNSLVVSHLAGWVFVALASWRLARFVEANPALSQANAWQRFLAGGAGFGKKRRRAPLLEINPVLWLMEDSPRLRWILWSLCGVGSILMISCIAMSGGAGVMFLSNCATPVFFLLKVLFAIQACRFFSETRRNGTLDLLRITPLPSPIIIDGLWLSLRRMFLWPVVVLASVELVCMSFFWVRPPQASLTAGFVLVFTLLFGVPLQLLKAAGDFLAIGWFGMWLALTAKKPQAATGLTILFVIVLPAVAICVPTIVIDLVLILVFRGKLRREFELIRRWNYEF